MILQPMPSGFSTGLHVHVEADEFFYIISGTIISGTGTATIGAEEHPIEAGDVIFVPAGQDHKITSGDDPLEVLEFLDKPGLDEEFRTWHRRYAEEDDSITLDELNEVSRQYGTIYKTLD